MDLQEIKQGYISSIKKIIPFDSKENQDISESLLWISQTRELCKPENLEKHLGAISILLSQDKKKTFLIHHKKAGVWLPPGGHVNKGQTFLETIAMELQEELGITTIDYINKDPIFLTQTTVHDKLGSHVDMTVWFLLQGDENKEYVVLEDEAFGGKWFAIEDILLDKQFAHLQRVFAKVKDIL